MNNIYYFYCNITLDIPFKKNEFLYIYYIRLKHSKILKEDQQSSPKSVPFYFFKRNLQFCSKSN